MTQPSIPIPHEEIQSHLAKRTAAWQEPGAGDPIRPKIVLSHGLFRYRGGSSPADLTAVEPFGFRVFLRARTRLFAVDGTTIGDARFYRIHSGESAASWLQEIRLLQKRKQIAQENGELRVLLVQAYHLMFYWLSFPARRAGRDLFLQGRDTPAATRRRALLSRDAVEATIRGAIERHAAMSARQTELLEEMTARREAAGVHKATD